MIGAGPLGVVLAGGAGARLGGAKALARLAGEPLLLRPLRALGEAVTSGRSDATTLSLIHI